MHLFQYDFICIVLINKLTVHDAMDVTVSNKFVPTVGDRGEDKRNSCAKYDAACITTLGSVGDYSNPAFMCQDHTSGVVTLNQSLCHVICRTDVALVKFSAQA